MVLHKPGILVVILVLALAVPGFAIDYYVSPDGNDANSGTGPAPNEAWRSISHAVTEARGTYNDHATVHIAAGVYTSDTEGNFPINIASATSYLVLDGAGEGQTVIESSSSTAINVNNINLLELSNLTVSGGRLKLQNIDDGGLTVSNVTVENSDDSGFYIWHVDNDVIFSNVTIQNTSRSNEGGALYLRDVDGDVQLSGLLIDGAESRNNHGGGIYTRQIYGNFELTNSSLIECTSKKMGGAALLYDIRGDRIFLNGVTVSGCETTHYRGGGIAFVSTSVDSIVLTNLTLNNNESFQGGGALYINPDNYNTDVRIDNFYLANNITGAVAGPERLNSNRYKYGSGAIKIYNAGNVHISGGEVVANSCGYPGNFNGWGAGISTYSTKNVTVTSSVFRQNEVWGSGGGLHIMNPGSRFAAYEATVECCTFLDNIATGPPPNVGDSGGLQIYTGDYANDRYYGDNIVVRNCLFAGNTCSNDGGGLSMYNVEADLVSLTFTDNLGPRYGHSIGILIRDGTVNIYNSIIWGNGNDDGSSRSTEIAYGIGNIDYYYSDVEWDDSGIVDGPGNINVNPVFRNIDQNDYLLLEGSPAIDAGAPDSDDSIPEAYRDYSHEPEPNGGRVNMGYYGGCWDDDTGMPVSESRKIVLRDKYIFIGSPVIPNQANDQQNPQTAWGDDMANTTPSWPEQTWRFSRWTNGTPYGDNQTYYGYLRFDEPERYIGIDIGDPPEIQSGMGYWLVWNYGAHDYIPQITVDINREMPPPEPIVLQLDSWSGNQAPPYGYNMMANPWPYPIQWSDIRFSTDQETWYTPGEAADMDWINRYAITWNHANEYYSQITNKIDPWEGFWVVVRTTEPIYMQFNPFRVSQDEPAFQMDELDEMLDWALMVTARRSDALQVDYNNWIGVGPDLSDTYDSFDALEVVPMAKEAVFLRSHIFPENEFDHRLTFDFRENTLADEDYKAWLMECFFYHDASLEEFGPSYPVDVKIGWPNITGVPGDVALRMYDYTGADFEPDPENLLVADMRTEDEYILNVDIPSGSEYHYRRFWIVATLDPGLLDTPEKGNGNLPTITQLNSVAPNPFNSTTVVSFDLSEASKIELRIFNVLGQQVAVLADKQFQPGTHSLAWNAQNLSSGIYFVVFNAVDTGVQASKKVVLTK